ncbi:PREDICTED: uncharacterized protein LOC105129413 isoform X2 [Populus euphratica]|uniref:Uncharacterized protein LOC105129413 isoform X2 n=1 Tax=Populus euphratica TaxID=75702 RepID=A0AAJ6UHD5_POPEU|nr:PREDICTED: uncharacterized protein LOC105129413 isoform X2 [Populus euphratica]
MASLVTHLCASLFLLPIGLRRLFCSSSLYLKNTSLFRSKTWCLLRRFDEEGMLIRKELGTETLTRKYTSGLVAGLSEEQCQCRKFLL